MTVKLERPATLAVFGVLLVVFVMLLLPRMFEVRKLKKRSSDLETQLRDLKKQNDALEGELRMLRDDPVYLEKVARAQFNKAKEGEIVYKVVREGQNTKTSQ